MLELEVGVDRGVGEDIRREVGGSRAQEVGRGVGVVMYLEGFGFGFGFPLVDVDVDGMVNEVTDGRKDGQVGICTCTK